MKQTHKVQKVSQNTNGLALLLQRVISGICLIVLFASPLAPIFAAEEIVEQDQTESIVTESVSVPPLPEVTPTEEVSEEVSSTESDTASEENVVVPEPETVSNEQEDNSGTETIPETVTEPNTDRAPSNPDSNENSTPPSETETQNTDPVSPETIASSSERTDIDIHTTATTTIPDPSIDETIVPVADVPVVLLDNPIDLKQATNTELTTAEPIEGETVTLSAITTDENRFVFGKSECVSAGDETFYCTKGAPLATPIRSDRVFSAVDSDGDKEIFVERGSIVTQVTSNNVDDDAPYFDELTNSLVWHRLIDGRYQIISYDIEKGEETQITHDRFNNMEPHRYGDTTVWQGWIGNDWEIMMLVGDELTMLTDNTVHDITPSINGDHVVWQSFEGDSWKMKVYDIRTKQIQTIEDSAGGSVENPRFVLVYDTKLNSGDVETRGFNLETGEVVSLGAKPVPVPEDIPDPDQTGEKRAIVSPVVQPKTKIDESDDDTPDVVGGNEPPEDDNGIQNSDIVIPALDIGTTTQSVGTSTVMDVTIPMLDTTSSSSVAHIEDLVIPTFIGTSTAPQDSQVPIVPVS